VITNIITNGNLNAGIRTEDECTILAHECQASAVASGASCLEITGAGTHVILGTHKYALSTAATFAVYLEVAARLDVADGDISLNAGSYAYRSGAAGAVLCAHNCKVSVTGGATTGFYADAGATVRIGSCVDVDATATPQGGAGVHYYSRGATVQVNGVTPVPVAWPDLKSTDRVMMTMQTPTFAGGQTFAAVAYTPGTGFAVTGFAGDTSVYDYVVL
jgi:hypothetical protein